MDAQIKYDLIDYVKEQRCGEACKKRLRDFCATLEPKTMTIYRGHKNSRQIRNNLWYSATKSYKVAKEEFAGDKCCVFKIHAVNVPIIDINAYVGDDIGHYAEEEECILLGGGEFYRNANMIASETGFTETIDKDGVAHFECWYTISKTNKSSPKSRSRSRSKTRDTRSLWLKVFETIPSEEYDFIDSPEDIMSDYDLTEDDRVKIYKKIKSLQPKNSFNGNSSRSSSRSRNSSKGGRKYRKTRTRSMSRTRSNLMKNKRKSKRKY